LTACNSFTYNENRCERIYRTFHASFIARRFSLLSNPFKAMALNSRIDRNELQKKAPTLTTACGLALRAFG